HVVDLDENGKLSCVLAAHDVGAAINPVNVEGQIEGGVVMSLGYALTEDFPLKEGVPTAKFGTLGLFKATQVPPIKAIIVEKSKEKLAYGAKGIGEICSIPTPPAVQLAYYNYDGNFRTKLPLENTPYSRKK
ncbi:MAG: molybdopterin cofactor-binding domain-containing protein, partial [Hydrogenoanaerobacterium sp.]